METTAYVKFIVGIPCKFAYDSQDELEDTLDSVLTEYVVRKLNSEVIEAPNGTFTLAEVLYDDMPHDDEILLNVVVRYTDDHAEEYTGDENTFISENSAVFAEFVEYATNVIEDILNYSGTFSKLPNADVAIIDGDLYVRVYDGQDKLYLNWSAPSVEYDDDADSVLSDIYYDIYRE